MFMVSNFVKHKYQLALFVVVLVLAIVNYTPGTWLTGWDDSHPEFNFGLNISRTVNAVWREHRGMGLVSGLAHSAQVFRYLFLWISSLLVPVSFIRYFWQFLMLFIGPLGVFYCSRSVFVKNANSEKRERVAFIASFFYLLNLVTLQTFYVPLETFTTQYGFLPWLFLYIFKLLERPSKKDVVVLAFLNLASASQAFTPTLFFAYISFVLLVFASHLIVSYSSVAAKNVGLVLSVIVISNLYWLLPFGYFVSSGNASKISQATINVLSSEESFLMNKQHGNISDFSVLRGFLFTTTDFNQESNSYEWLLDRWVIYQSNVAVKCLGCALFAVVLVGLVASLAKLKRKDNETSCLTLVLFFFASFFFLLGDNPPLGFVFRFMQTHLPFFGEALRFPFTKYSILACFTFSILFGVGFSSLWLTILRFVKSSVSEKLAGGFVFAVCVIVLVFWTLPMFQGELIYKRMRVKIPQDYFSMFDWFNQQKDQGRILKLPIQTYWSWGFNDWGYRGSGFTWYGIKQPTIDRAFDVWSTNNESVYREVSYAVYSNDALLFKEVLKKYGISYILLDSSTYEPKVLKTSEFMGFNVLSNFLSDNLSYKQEESFGFLKIYSLLSGSRSGVEALSGLPQASPVALWLPKDLVYQNEGNYYTNDRGIGEIYPFRGVCNYLSMKSDYDIMSSRDSYKISSNLSRGGTLQIPNYHAKEKLIQAKIRITGGELSVYPVFPRILTNGREISFSHDEPLYKVKLPLKVTTSFLITIDKDVYGPIASGEDRVDIGTVVLDMTRSHVLAVWDVASAKSVDMLPLYKVAEVDSCIDQDSGSYELERLAGGIKLTSENNTACIAATVGLVSDLGLVKLEYTGSFDNAEINYCIYGEDDCLNDKKYDREYLLLNKLNLPFTAQFYSTPISKEKPAVSEFTSINLVKYPLIITYNLEPLSLGDTQSLQAQDVSIGAGTLTIEISKPVNYRKAFIFEDFDNPNLKSLTHECNFNSDVSVDTDFKKTLNFVKRELEVATEGKSSCFTLTNTHLSHNTGYFVDIPFKRISGKSQKFCLQNSYTERCDLIYKLEADEKGVYQKGQFFIPRYTDGGEGYKLTIENTSIGDDRSVNSYDDIGVYPFPFDFVGGIRVVDESLVNSVALNGIVKPTYNKLSNFIYKINVSNIKNQQIIVVNQAYEHGWIAFCGLGLCQAEHVLVNNWANGWVFNGSRPLPDVVTIIFWPQILEYLGFAGLVVWFALLVKSHISGRI